MFWIAIAALGSSWAFSAYEPCSVTTETDPQGAKISAYFRPLNPKRLAVAILPPTGGEILTDRNLADRICESGVNSYVFDYVQEPGDAGDLQTHDRASKRTLQAIGRFLAAHDKKFVVVGASLGGLYASMAFGIARSSGAVKEAFPGLEKIVGAVLTVTGGSLSEILATSQLEGVVEQRSQRMQKLGFRDEAEYQSALEKAIELDPIRFSDAGARDRVLMFSSENDVAVPTPTQHRLWENWGRPKRKTFDSNHAWTIGRVYLFHAGEIARFCKRILTAD